MEPRSCRGAAGHSRAEAVVVTFGGAEANDGVDHGGRIHGREAVDQRHDDRVHLAVVAVDRSGVGEDRLGGAVSTQPAHVGTGGQSCVLGQPDRLSHRWAGSGEGSPGTR